MRGKPKRFDRIIFDGDIIENCDCHHCPWEIGLISGGWKWVGKQYPTWNAFKIGQNAQHLMVKTTWRVEE